MPLGRSDLTARIAQDLHMPRGTIADVIDAFERAVTEALASGDSVRLPGFLTLTVADRAPRTGRNPRTGDTLHIPASKAVKVTAGAALKSAASGGGGSAPVAEVPAR